MSDMVIEMEKVGKGFRRTAVLSELSMHVPRGSIYAFLGENGEGKTTTIRLMLNLLTPERGSVKVLGKDSVRDSEFIKSRVGYVPETPVLYDWMTVEETVRFTSRFYPDWNPKIAAGLLSSLNLPARKRVQELSQGTRAKVGLLLALSHEPEILILDDSTSGLDALVRREFLEHIVSLVEEGKKTIFFSSHIITELERVADWVGLLKGGKLSFEKPLEELKNHVKRLHMVTSADFPLELLQKHSGTILTHGKKDNEITIITKEWNNELLEELRKENPVTLDISDLELEDIFVEFTRPQKALLS